MLSVCARGCSVFICWRLASRPPSRSTSTFYLCIESKTLLMVSEKNKRISVHIFHAFIIFDKVRWSQQWCVVTQSRHSLLHVWASSDLIQLYMWAGSYAASLGNRVDWFYLCHLSGMYLGCRNRFALCCCSLLSCWRLMSCQRRGRH